ncbi:hypothetical protein EMCRGX_G016420 [Ephydatia muelleri]
MRWPQYLFLLRHCMRQLPKKHLNHKVFIKTVVAILDAFHFDLSLATPPGHATESFRTGEEMEVEKGSELPGHKLSKMQHVEEAEMLCVPAAMAMTKLLMSLPKSTLHTHLPNLLMKVCHSLKNRSRDVHDVARETLVKMATILGPRDLQHVIKEMKSYSPKATSSMMIAKEDLFGLPAEVWEIGELVAMIPESKTPHSLNTYIYEITA